MPESFRLINYFIALIAGILLAVFTGQHFWDRANKLDSFIYLHASKKVDEEAQAVTLSIREECSDNLAPAIKLNCIIEKTRTYREAERNERDLEAQQIMANWTRVMGKAAIIGMGVGIVGLFLIFTTFWETRKAAQAGFAANDIARKSRADNLRIGETQLSAHLIVNRITLNAWIDKNNREYLFLNIDHFKIRNEGSAAHRIRFVVKTKVKIGSYFQKEYTFEEELDILQRSAEGGVDTNNKSSPIPTEIVQNTPAEEMTAVVIATIEFLDIFGKNVVLEITFAPAVIGRASDGEININADVESIRMIREDPTNDDARHH